LIPLQAQILWEPDMRLTNALGSCLGGHVAVCGDTIYVLYDDAREPVINKTEVYFIRSTDAGVTWSAEMLISPFDSTTSWASQIASRGDTVHVVYADYRYVGECVIYYRRSIDGGVTWQAETLLSPWWRNGGGPGIVLGNSDDVYVVWDDFETSPHLLMFTKSLDGGTTWLPYSVVDSSGYSSPFGFIYNQQCLHLVSWRSLGIIGCEVDYRRSTDYGVTWSDFAIISPYDSAGSQWPATYGDALGNLYVTWFDYKYSPYPWTGDIFFCRSTDNGLSWLPYQQLTDLHHAVGSDICVSGDFLYVVWEDDRWGADTSFEICFRMSTDRGETWLPEERLTNAPKNSNHPQIAVSKERLHVIWKDHRDGPYPSYSELYYKRGRRFVGIEDTTRASIKPDGKLEVYPNPSSGVITIRYSMNDTQCPIHDIGLHIYDATGRLVKSFDPVSRIEHQGSVVLWHGDDDNGKKVPRGVYFIQIDNPDSGDMLCQKVCKVK
jgi:hypothetical protein